MKRLAYFVVTAFLVAVSCTNDEEKAWFNK